MRSADTSDGVFVGFPNRFLAGATGVLAQISPVTYAVAVTAFLAATLFVANDVIRTFAEINERASLIARLSEAQPLLSRQFVATAFDPIAEEADTNSTVVGLVQRGGIAYGLAFLLAGVAYRRRPVSAKTSAHPYSDLIATIPFGVACWSPEGRLIACNAQYRARLNAEPADIAIGASYDALVRRLVQGGHMRMVTEDDRSRLIELHRQDGSCLMIEERPLPDGGFVTLLNDVTETRRTGLLLTSIREEQRLLARRYHEEKLRAEAASKAKTVFLAHLSHDIRTPLNHIIGFAELMRQQAYGPLGNERYAEYIESIRTSGERLLTFFASTLDLAELEGGSRTMNPVAVEADTLVEEATRRFSAQAQRKGITLAIGARCGATLLGDRFALERMLNNLVDNAIRFTPTRGRVLVAAYAADDGVVLEVTDTGIGMSSERLSEVSQPFAFGDAALTREREGTGLGLAIARAIVELNGGHLAIDSRPNLGTTVAVSLPLLREAKAA